MTDIITFLRENHAAKKQEKASRTQMSRPKRLETEYNERLQVRAVVSQFKKAFAISIITAAVAITSSLLLASALKDFWKIREHATPLDAYFASLLDKAEQSLGWTNDGIIATLAGVPVFITILAIVVIVVTTYPMVYAWRKSRIVVNRETFRIESSEILKTGGRTEFDPTLLRGTKVHRSFLDILFVNCGTVEVFMTDLSGDNDQLLLRFVRNPAKLQRVVGNIIRERREKEK